MCKEISKEANYYNGFETELPKKIKQSYFIWELSIRWNKAVASWDLIRWGKQ